MLNVLVTGGDGQLGQSFASLNALAEELGFNLILSGRSQLDITDKSAVSRFIETNCIHTVVNAAAYTAVDKAESESDAAYLVNAIGAEVLAEACHAHGAWMIQISTDYVFDGLSDTPYAETDQVNPLSVYGVSKLRGEGAVLSVLPDAVVLRTSWVFSEFGQNFLKTMLRLGGERDALSIVADQQGAPTYAPHIAEVVLRLIKMKAEGERIEGGVYHFTGAPVSSWCEFARCIFDTAERAVDGFQAPEVSPIDTASYPTAATRPMNSALCLDKLEALVGPLNNHWRVGVEQSLDRLSAE